MSVESWSNHQLWYSKTTTIPERSRLHPLEPIGVGTPTVLEAALSLEPPQSLRQVAATIGYDPGDISRFFPDLCHQISARYRLYRQTIKKS